jgi:hypothetical protein
MSDLQRSVTLRISEGASFQLTNSFAVPIIAPKSLSRQERTHKPVQVFFEPKLLGVDLRMKGQVQRLSREE